MDSKLDAEKGQEDQYDAVQAQLDRKKRRAKRFAAAGLVLLWGGYQLASSAPFGELSFSDLTRPCHSFGGVVKDSSAIKWTACEANANLSCASITVPKNYFDSSKGTSTIAIAKLPATAPAKDQLGSIFINPGGPGGRGVSFAMRFAPTFSRLLEGRYNIIGFDPRGIGASTPRIDCFNSTLDFELFKANTILEHGFDLPHDPFSHEAFASLTAQQKELSAMLEAQYKVCRENVDLEDLKQSGTSTVVRDIEEISSQLDGPEARINFAGFSYGTIIGAYLVNMLPAHKLGRVVIDGVVSAPLWAGAPTYTWDEEGVTSAEASWAWYLRDCARAGPEGCALATEKENTPELISKKVMNYLDALYEAPVPVTNSYRPGHLNSGGARGVLYADLSGPSRWPASAQRFADAIAGNPKDLYEQLISPFTLNEKVRLLGDSSRQAVSCADVPPFGEGEGTFPIPTAEFLAETTIKALRNSPHFGGSVQVLEPDGGCQFWGDGSKAEGRFAGPWNNTLDTPLLIISNTADPDTPISSGRELNKLMGSSSRLLVQNSTGHCSSSTASSCTQSHYRAFFLDGVLPQEDEFYCETDVPTYFPPKGVESVQTQGEMAGLAREVAAVWDEWTKK